MLAYICVYAIYQHHDWTVKGVLGFYTIIMCTSLLPCCGQDWPVCPRERKLPPIPWNLQHPTDTSALPIARTRGTYALRSDGLDGYPGKSYIPLKVVVVCVV